MLANVKTALAARGLQQAQLAESAGLPESRLSKFIHEKCELPPYARTRISEILQADPEWLFSRVTRIPAPKQNGDPQPALACTA